MRATHLFLPDREIKNIKAYVPQAKGFYEHMGFHIYKMEAVVSLRRFENMIKRFLKYVDGKKECYFCILNLNKLFKIILCLVESVKQFVVFVNGAKFVTQLKAKIKS